MISAQERRRLLRAMHAEPVRAWMVLARCAAGLAVIALIAAIGASDSVGQDVSRNVAPAATPHSGQTAQAHRKQVFDERRASSEKRARRDSGVFEVVDLPRNQPMELF
jgi:hypothetical protein